MIINPTARGKRTEAKILGELALAGKSVLIPWGEERYDLALDEDGRLVRIQCKTGWLRNGCVFFRTCVADIRRPNGDGGYHGQIEAFAVYCPDNGKTYFVPIAAVPCPTLATLRVEPTLNGQIHGVRWARDFELTPDRLSYLLAPGV